ncbi:MAG: type IV secretion system DNA-binding domain-containing protein [Candidatus Omnitrophota bacterium]
MNFWQKLFGVRKEELPEMDEDISTVPQIHYEDIPGTLDLGWYYSENKDEYQMAKINQKDRATHFYVIGATGTGKTKFLEFLIQQDIEKGNGFGVIDPHGDLIDDIKGFLACRYNENEDEEEISERVVLIDPTDPNFTVTFNPLENLPNVSIAEQTNELVGSFKKIWSDSWGVRMEDLMRNSLIALGEAGFTLVELPRFLTTRAFREIVLEKVSHPIAQDYFRRFEVLTDRGQITWIEPVMNKINAFFSDERIRYIFSSPKSSFNLREIMDQKKILLIKLDKGKLKDAADLLGSLLMAKIQMAAFSRTDLPQNKRTPFYLYIDEFQNFASESFSVILSEARKYGLSLIMAHQTLSQISPELRSLILGNAGIQVYFRINRQDAQLLAKEAFDYSGYEVKSIHSTRPVFWSYAEEWEHKIGDLQNLSPRICYAKHKIEGGVIPFQTMEIEPACENLKMEEDEYQEFLKTIPFSKKYLVSRKELTALADQRNKLIDEEIAARPVKEKKLIEAPVRPSFEEIEKLIKEELPRERIEVKLPKFEEEKRESQHRYLQALIKWMGEEKGYKAVVEQPTPDGQGRVDVSLERNGKKIACEISLTSTEEQELKNIEKCLSSGYEKVILCSPEKKILEKVESLVIQKLKESELKKVLFLQPEELFFFLEQEGAREVGREERVKGYKVKVSYQPVKETEKASKREAVAGVILSALRRLKGGK